jgi:hypothetical protein
MPKTTQAERDMEAAQANASNVLRHVIEASEATPTPAHDTRNAAAVALGKLGASKGGKARAKALNKSERSKIARLAAQTRWNKK